LFKVVVGGEGWLDVVLLHDDEGTAINEWPGFIGAGQSHLKNHWQSWYFV